MSKAHLSIVLFIISFAVISQNNSYYTHKNFGIYFEEFQEQNDLLNFVDVKKGDVVADIGAGNGYYTAALSLLFDSVTFYAEDISSKKLRENRFAKHVNHFARLKGSTPTNTFHVSIGNYTATNLPANSLDKVFLMASFHEFSNMNLMLKDIDNKLKKNGKIYVMEAFSLPGDTIYCSHRHKGYSISQVTAIMKNHNFYLSKMRNPEGKTVNYTNCLIFERDKESSRDFYRMKDSLEGLVNLSRQMANIIVAGDGVRMQNITDSLKLVPLLSLKAYSAYETWLRSIGKKWTVKQKYIPAINVFNSVCELYPNNAQNYFVLARAFQSNAQYDKALENYKKVLRLEPGHNEALKQVHLLEGKKRHK
ncbi:MAG: Methyltransferase type 11 [Bacteroidetes bacterium]|nr:Methyltransferase type 11 [Bacteroidota bacterium]